MMAAGPRRRWVKRWVAYPLQAALLCTLLFLFRLLPVDAASALGGRIGRTVGPRLTAANRRAAHNLARSFPEKSAAERGRILLGMWDNVGRILAEYAHLVRLRDGGRIETVGLDTLTAHKAAGGPLILIGAHIGNWELPGVWCARHARPITTVYRPPNNRSVDRLIGRIRSAAGMVEVRKGTEGTRAALKALSEGRNLGMLLDQKLNRGIALPFFGREAMTTPALGLFALRFDCPVVPIRVERTGGANFRVTVCPPLEISRTGDREADVAAIMTRVNRMYEDWIRERPEQWLWMHRRWKDSVS